LTNSYAIKTNTDAFETNAYNKIILSTDFVINAIAKKVFSIVVIINQVAKKRKDPSTPLRVTSVASFATKIFLNPKNPSMKKRRLRIGFGRFSDSDFLTFAKSVEVKMTGNDNFPTPQPTLAVVGTAITDYETALANAADGGKTETALKNQKRAALDAVLKQLASYVELVADDDEAKLLSSGFDLSKTPTPAGPLGAAQNFRVEAGDKGQLKLVCDANKQTRVYKMGYKQVGETAWTEVDSTSSRLLLTDLESGKEYVCRVLLVGTSPVRT
jgi:hypothetical protein